MGGNLIWTGNQLPVIEASQEADWILRSTASGVVFAHDFRNVAEVDNFRQSNDVSPFPSGLPGGGLDPGNLGANTVSWLSSSGIGSSGALRTSAPYGFAGLPSSSWYERVNSAEGWIHFPAGTTYTPIDTLNGTYNFPGGGSATYTRVFSSDPTPRNTACYVPGYINNGLIPLSRGGWNRPLFPIAGSSNGRGVNDPAVGGTIPLRTWNINSRSTIEDNREGYGFYGHPDYAGITNSNFGSGQWQGTQFWVQLRIRISANRFTPRNDPTGGNASSLFINLSRNGPSSGDTNIHGTKEYPPGGKLMFVEKLGGGTQELILISGGGADAGYFAGSYPARVYTGFGSHLLDDFTGGVIEPGSPYAATCNINGSDVSQPGACWEWPTGEWVTFLMHVIPGHDGVADTTVEYWVARAGETSYTRLYTCSVVKLNYDLFGTTGIKPGFQNIALNCYFNNQPSFVGIDQDYTQIIVSHNSIPCPVA